MKKKHDKFWIKDKGLNMQSITSISSWNINKARRVEVTDLY